MSDSLSHHEVLDYVAENPVMVLGTLGADGTPHGAAIYGVATSSDQLYFVTKTETQKCRDIVLHPTVSITIVNASENSSLQANGRARVENEPHTIEIVMTKITSVYTRTADWLPPIAKIRAGTYCIIGVKLRFVRLARFKGEPIGSAHIFREGNA